MRLLRWFKPEEMKNAYLLQMRAKEEKMHRAREDEAAETAVTGLTI